VDGTRSRRTKDGARKLWYASQRQWRFSRFIWGLAALESPSPLAQGLCRPMPFDRLDVEDGSGSLPIGDDRGKDHTRC